MSERNHKDLQPAEHGKFISEIDNAGLKWLTLRTLDSYSRAPGLLLNKRVEFANHEAVQTGAVYSETTSMVTSHPYQTIANPSGQKEACALITDDLTDPTAPVTKLIFAVSYQTDVNGASGIGDLDVAIVEYRWN